jgi:hypothetical protein
MLSLFLVVSAPAFRKAHARSTAPPGKAFHVLGQDVRGVLPRSPEADVQG